MYSYLIESSPTRCPRVDGLENELPVFQRFDRYPTELGSDWEKGRESSNDSVARGDGSLDWVGELPGTVGRAAAAAFPSASSDELGRPVSDPTGDVDSGSEKDRTWNGEVLELPRIPDEVYGRGSEDRICMPPYLRAAISCGERGRDFLRSFWRRFWNHIWQSASVLVEDI